MLILQSKNQTLICSNLINHASIDSSIKYLNRAIERTGRVGFHRLQHKDKKFEYERELRLFTGLYFGENKGKPPFPISQHGEKIPCKVIEKIIGPKQFKSGIPKHQIILRTIWIII
jgi:hypothetical protein